MNEDSETQNYPDNLQLDKRT